jgi:VanZ family protein
MSFYLRKVDPKTDFSLWRHHHFYVGLMLCLIAFILLFNESVDWLAWAVLVLGLWNVIDDFLQHYIQKRELKKYGYWQTVTFWHWWPQSVIKRKKQ